MYKLSHICRYVEAYFGYCKFNEKLEKGIDRIMCVFLGVLGPAIAALRVQSYTNYMENQKGGQIFDLLKYYPADK